jgi:hypothetical protein
VTRDITVAKDSMDSRHFLRSDQIEGGNPGMRVRAIDDATDEKLLVDENIVNIHRFAGDMF